MAAQNIHGGPQTKVWLKCLCAFACMGPVLCFGGGILPPGMSSLEYHKFTRKGRVNEPFCALKMNFIQRRINTQRACSYVQLLGTRMNQPPEGIVGKVQAAKAPSSICPPPKQPEKVMCKSDEC
jgi:hypothetical protein